MSRGTLKIEVYTPPAPADSTHIDLAVSPHAAAGKSSSNVDTKASRCVVAATGGFASLLLHALFIASVTLGGTYARQHPSTPPVPYAVGAHDGAESAYTMELEMIDDVDPGILSDKVNFAAPMLVSVTASAALANPVVEIRTNPDETLEAFGAETGERSILVGRYLGQIDARIERAWRRPRTPLSQGLFSCRVRIEQGPHGEVGQITLERCNGDTRWQLSLVHAIQFASPLPAPPDPTVFKPVIHMDFRSDPYTALAEQDAYEPGGFQSSDGAGAHLR